jgi:Phospholipase_D-nuclease N-terminal
MRCSFQVGNLAPVTASGPLAFDAFATGISLASLIALLLAVSAFGSVVRSADLSSSAKTMWVVVVVLFPIFGPIVYFGVRNDW